MSLVPESARPHVRRFGISGGPTERKTRYDKGHAIAVGGSCAQWRIEAAEEG